MTNLNDAFDDEPRIRFQVNGLLAPSPGFVIMLGHLNIFIGRARLAELHAVIGAALAANPEAPAGFPLAPPGDPASVPTPGAAQAQAQAPAAKRHRCESPAPVRNLILLYEEMA
jgi:hypothetical protein